MNYKFLKSLCGLFLLSVGIHAFAKVDLTLNQLRQEVLSENLDIQIQYEKYYQAQKNVSVALGQFLPSANMNMIYVNTTLAILQSVVPTPSDWFAYDASKELRMAEKFTTEAIKLNMLEGLTANFINLKYHEALLASLKTQETLLNEVYEQTKKNEELGSATATEVFVAKRLLLQHRQDIFHLNTLIIAEKQAMLIALNRQPSEELTLAALPAEDLSVIPARVEDGAALAIENSPELISKSYQAEAARYMVASKRWSFISFNGIGFDYAANLSIEKSKARIIELETEQIALKISNQVYAAYDSLDILDQRIAIQKEVVAATIKNNERTAELYMNNAASFSAFTTSRNEVTSEERALVRLEMERKIKITNLKRLLGLDSSLTADDASQYNDLALTSAQEGARRGATHVWMNIEGSTINKADIFSVVYNVENIITDRRLLATESDLSLYFKAATKGSYKVTAKIKMVSGIVILKETVVVVK